MTSVAPVAPMAGASQSEWSESRILASLDQLQNMHIQLRQVRSAIPQLVEPLLLQNASPGDLYMRYSQNALHTGREIRTLADLMENPMSQAILQKAKEDRVADLEGITPWMVTEHPDWLEVRKNVIESSSPAQAQELQTIGDGSFPAVQDPRAAVERFRAQHHGIEINFQEFPKIIEMYLSPPFPIHFRIDLDSATPIVTCTEKTKIHLGALRAIAARLRNTPLDYLLEMLVSYDDVRSRPCVKCDRVVDMNGQFPVVRARKDTSELHGSLSTQWQAFHEGCV